MASIFYRELRPEDARACAKLEELFFAEEGPWSEDEVRSSIIASWSFYLGCFAGTEQAEGRLLGYAGLGVLGPTTDPECEVQTIGVDPSAQGMGLGRGLMDQLLFTVDKLRAPTFLEVRTDNAAALGLYRSLGFEITGTRKGYYQPAGADAYTMARPAKKEGQRP